MSYPRIVIDLNKLRHNICALVDMAHEHSVGIAAVTKVFCADSEVVSMLDDTDIAFLADSRIQNLAKMGRRKHDRLLLRIGMRSELDGILSHSEISCQSDAGTIKLLGELAAEREINHKVIIMIDVGDLREGIPCDSFELILDAARAAVQSKGLTLFGLGTNITCFGAILPDEHNMSVLVNLKARLERELSLHIPILSGGNSSSVEYMRAGKLPREINNLRLGESYALAKDTAYSTDIDGLYNDAIRLEIELIEVYNKSSVPRGTSSLNAFGEKVSFVDKGEMRRGILAIGRQDTVETGLRPIGNFSIEGASSDHLIVDLTRMKEAKVGDVLRFIPDYGALLRAMTSPYVQRTYI